MRGFFTRDAAVRTREALLTLLAVLLSFGCAYALKRAERLTPSIEVLAVALALSLSRSDARHGQRDMSSRLLGIAVLPAVAVGASEIGTLLFQHAEMGDALFVAAVTLTVYARRFSDQVRRIATFALLPLVSILVVPGVAVVGGGSGDARWWSALVAVTVLGWVTVVRVIAGHFSTSKETITPARAVSRTPRVGEPRRMAGTTKMAIQMGVGLAGGFALGRWLFSPHWSWCVLTVFIVSSANRGREDVLHKGVMRLLGAGVGTVLASLISGLFPAGYPGAIVVIFCVLTVALWLRPLSYAFWAGGMTAALALLYGYYGEQGISMLGSRLEAIALGAVLAVATAWAVWPIRTTDIIRRDVGAALAALDGVLESLVDESAEENLARRATWYRRTVAALEPHRALLSAIPGPLRAPIDHLPALSALEAIGPPAYACDLAAVMRLRKLIGGLRKTNGAGQLPDPARWDRLVRGVAQLAAATEGPAPTPRDEPSSRV